MKIRNILLLSLLILQGCATSSFDGMYNSLIRQYKAGELTRAEYIRSYMDLVKIEKGLYSR